jgi:hypothetical protein
MPYFAGTLEKIITLAGEIYLILIDLIYKAVAWR